MYQLIAIKIFGPPIEEIFTSLAFIPNGETYENNLSLFGMMHSKQFIGGDTEDAYQHVHLFDEMCVMFKLNAFIYDEMKLKFFFQTLATKAKGWQFTHPANTFDTWKKYPSPSQLTSM